MCFHFGLFRRGISRTTVVALWLPHPVHMPARRVRMRRQVQIAHLKYPAITHTTLRRYKLSVKSFFAWARSSKLRLPHSFLELDGQLSEYFNFLFLDDRPMHWAADSLSGFKRLLPSCKRHLNISNLYYKNWTKCLMRERAIPLSANLVQGMAAAAFTKQ